MKKFRTLNMPIKVTLTANDRLKILLQNYYCLIFIVNYTIKTYPIIITYFI